MCCVRLTKCGLFGRTSNMGCTCAGKLNIIHMKVQSGPHKGYVGNFCIP